MLLKTLKFFLLTYNLLLSQITEQVDTFSNLQGNKAKGFSEAIDSFQDLIADLNIGLIEDDDDQNKIVFNPEARDDGPNRPIILIPGILGSVLEARLNRSEAAHWICYKKSDWFKIWIDSSVLVPQYSDCWIENMKLEYTHIDNGGVKNQKGVQLRTPNYGIPTGSIDYLDPGSSYWTSIGNYFATMRDWLVKNHNFKEGHDLFAAPYDWRLTPNLNLNKQGNKGPLPLDSGDFCDGLQNLLQTASKANYGMKVTVVAHSMGNLFFHYCVEKVFPRDFTEKYIHSYTNIAGPMAGAPKALTMITSGENENIAILRPNQIRVAERSWPSSYLLLPNPMALNKTMRNKNFMEIKGFRNYTSTQYKDFFDYVSKNFPDQHFEHSRNLFNEYSGQSILGSVNALNIRTLCVWGSGLDTTNKLMWKKKEKFPDYSPYENEMVSGDGTVPEWSIKPVCERWEKEQQKSQSGRKVSYLDLPSYDHVSVLHSEKTFNAIIKISKEKFHTKSGPEAIDYEDSNEISPFL